MKPEIGMRIVITALIVLASICFVVDFENHLLFALWFLGLAILYKLDLVGG
jgi:hypothetical protein